MTDAKQAALHRVLAAIAVLGTAETRDIATEAGVAYSTVTSKLRALEGDSLAERLTTEGKSVWKLTAAGLLAAAVTSDATETDPPLPDSAPTTDDTDATNADTDVTATADTETVPNVETAPDAEDADEAANTGDTDLAGESPLTAEGADAEHGGDSEEPDPNADAAPNPDTAPTGGATHDDAVADEDDGSAARTAAATADDSSSTEPEDDEPVAKPVADGEEQPKARRRGGTLRDAALAALRKLGPSKVGAVCKAIDEANAGTGAAKASPGAVRNALDKLTEDGLASLVVERPATFDAR